MTRQWVINGESMVSVRGMQGTAIQNIQQLGLTSDPIRITPNFRHRDIQLDAYGGEVPPEVQMMLADVTINFTLIHYDVNILNACINESLAGGDQTNVAGNAGAVPRAGTLMGGQVARFAAGNHYIGLNILSPVANYPWRFLTCYMTGPPMTYPLGTEKSAVITNWRCIPFSVDPWNNGLGAQGQLLWDHITDS